MIDSNSNRFARNHLPDCPLVLRIREAHPKLCDEVVASRGHMLKQLRVGKKLQRAIGATDFATLSEANYGESCPHP